MWPTRAEETTDEVGNLFPPVTQDTTGTLFSLADVFAVADSVVLVDSSVIISEVKKMVPRLVMRDWAFGTPLEEGQNVSALQATDYHRLYNSLLVNRISQLNTLLPATDIMTDFTRTHSTVTPESVGLTRQFVSQPHDLVERLLGFAGLPAGWDGYSGKPIEGHTVERTVELLNDIYKRTADEGTKFPDPTVGPTPGGSIQLEWDLPQALLAVEIPRRSEPLSFYLEYADGREVGSDAASPDDVWQAIKVAFGV